MQLYCIFLGDGDVPCATLLDLCNVKLQEIIEPGQKLLSEYYAPLATRVLFQRRTCLDSPMMGDVLFSGNDCQTTAGRS